jgi:hypothetical protein
MSSCSPALLLLALACAPKQATTTDEVRGAGIISERPAEGGLTEQQVDLNGDGKADVWNYYRERLEGPRVLAAKKVDLNWDGKQDVSTAFDNSGSITKEEMDQDFDGRVDWVDHYQGGKRVLTEADTNNDTRFDLFKVYESGKVRRKERDMNGDGKIDFWEYLDEAGNVVKVGKDVDGDGVMDQRQD